MTDSRTTPEGLNAPDQGQVADAVTGNWVDTRAPVRIRPYLRLSRLDRPIGTWLLLLPCWWGLTLAMLHDGNLRWQDLWIFVGCGIGAVLMRGAGCTWNDITDRHIDGSVARTASRPIPSGQVSTKQALAWAVAQCLVAFLILITFNLPAILLGILALAPVAIYPFAKRFTWWPQVFLGIAFNWGALLVWTAHTGRLELPAVLLYFAGMSWTLFYDTIYAHQDKEDDALIGVKSTARLFDKATPLWLTGFLILTLALMGLAIVLAIPQGATPMRAIALIGAGAMGAHLIWQLLRLKLDDNDRLLRLFRSNRDAGLIPVLFFAVALFA
ncbi:4-hydroxybenzoate polyprenyltransferase [Puniceibacterium antarcticum]|uniref:4-hydroxybenzoate octaprenyltransferase n=1 Tax=Puniceibacterium antarcticum TaxID=1206336 RepID=A0A2G8RFF9_9RHOB|nr:4-hydroxybenzoate octaprenyltransferase [Puniceibacterium antarcticum]PIL20336.1 4-hydroxybenzoate polyprenyltransferase [Puniceibacterium antarcticum]